MAKNKNTNENTSISKSKAKREERRREVAKERRKKRIIQAAGIIVAAAIIVIIAAAVGERVYLAAIRTTPSSDMSAGLTAEGKIEGVDAVSSLNLVDFENISIPMDEVAATTDEVETAIASTLESYTALSADENLTVADGDQVNIDYVGTIDGVEFEGGSSGGAGYDLTIGSGTFIDDFEQQLIGHAVGDDVTVEVTFPDDYSGDVAGKDASFAVTINGIMVTPELTDEFVAENLAETEGVSTASEYRAKVENEFYEEHLEDYLTTYIMDNSTVTSYPNSYVKIMKSILKYDDESMVEYYNELFTAYGIAAYENVWDTRGTEIDDELSYERELTERAREGVKTALVYQAIFEKAGLSIDMDAAIAEMTELNGREYVENIKATYGEGYMAQAEMKEVVIEYLVNRYK